MYCLNRQHVPTFCPKKALKKGDVLSKQTTRLCLFVPIWLTKKIACKSFAGYFYLKEGRCFFNNLFVNFL